jgi:hypothetical protein
VHQLVRAPADADANADLLPVRILHEVERIDGRVDDVAEQVAHSGWPDQRNEEVGTRANAIPSQRVPE